MLITSPIFLLISWKVASATNTITEWLVGDQKKEVLPSSQDVTKKLAYDGSMEKRAFSGGDNSSEIIRAPSNSFRKSLNFVTDWNQLPVRTGVMFACLWLLNWVCPFIAFSYRQIYPTN